MLWKLLLPLAEMNSALVQDKNKGEGRGKRKTTDYSAQKNHSMNHGWQSSLTGWEKNQQLVAATSANTLNPVQPHH